MERARATHERLLAVGISTPGVVDRESGRVRLAYNVSPDGVLDGRPSKPGQIAFTVAVEDSVKNRTTKELRTVVAGSLQFSWFQPPQVHGDRMEGAVQLSNGTKDDFVHWLP